MSKTLRIEYAGTVIHDAAVDEFQWSETADSIAVLGKVKAAKPATANGLLEALTAVRKSQTAALAEQKVRELDATETSTDAIESEPEGTSD